MPGFTQARCQAILNSEIVNGDKVGYSENGTSETANLAKTTVAAWDSATAAVPSVRANTAALLSAGASGACDITHFAIFDSAGTTQKTDWDTLAVHKVLAIGEKLEHAAGTVTATLQ